MTLSNQSLNMKTTNSFIEYKAAIALNNISVALLNRCCYNDALASFQNAFTLMKSSLKSKISNKSSSFNCFNDNNSTNETPNQSRLLPQEMLHQASINLAKSANVKTSRSNDEHSDILHPIILTADKTSNSILDLLNMPASTTNCCTIRIDDDGFCDFDETVPLHDYIIEIAIILNNIGTVYRCYASDIKSSSLSSSSKKDSTKKSKKIGKALKSGLSFCKAAQGILASMDDDEATDDEIKRQGLLNLLILDNLMSLSSDMRDIEYSRQYYIEHGDLLSMLLETIFADDDDDDDSIKSRSRISDEVGSCFYVDNKIYFVTAAGAA